jgi:hypothetical protein
MNRTMVLLLALACAVSPGIAHRVRVDFDHGSHFSRFRTYRWVPAKAAPSGEVQLSAQFPNQLMQQRVVTFIDEALSARGLRRVETGGDLLISSYMNVTETPQFTTVTNGTGFGWGWDGGSAVSVTTVQPIVTGTLVVDMTDARQNQLVFQGVSRATISSRPSRNTRRLSKAINEIFEKYPPQT